MENDSKLNYAIDLLPDIFKKSLAAMKSKDYELVQEIRFRTGKKVTVTIGGKEFFVTLTGKLSSYQENGINISQSDFDYIIKRACQYSLHSYQKEISNGFITTNGGNRVGICGTAVVSSDDFSNVETIKDISSINIRIAREIKGCADEIYNKLLSFGINSILIVGIPSSGKTTILRDLCRQAGNNYKVCVIDERNEISAVSQGFPQNDIGKFTDVFNGYPRARGITTAIRVMSPQVIFCDEIGGAEDVQTLEYALNSGVSVIATTHASSIEQAMEREGINLLVKKKIFDYAVLLGSAQNVGKVMEIKKVGV